MGGLVRRMSGAFPPSTAVKNGGPVSAASPTDDYADDDDDDDDDVGIASAVAGERERRADKRLQVRPGCGQGNCFRVSMATAKKILLLEENEICRILPCLESFISAFYY